MSIRFSCACGKAFHLKDELAGKKGKCPQCGEVLNIPHPPAPADEPVEFDLAPLPPQISKPSTPRPAMSAPRVAAPVPPAMQKPYVSAPMPALTATAAGAVPMWRRFSFMILLLALIPLAMSVLMPDNMTQRESFKQTVKAHPEVLQKLLELEASHGENSEVTEDELFGILPNHKFDSALLSHDTWAHWGFALVSSAVFTGILLLVLPKTKIGVPKLLLTALFTATVGIFLLLGFQWVANFTQGFWVRGGGILTLVFYIVKFVGFSYRAALDPDNGFVLSALGFTFGVGLCEELCKSMPVLLHYGRNGDWPWRTAVAIGFISGVGFGVSEGITYSSDYYNGIMGQEIYWVRFVSCVALHAVWAGASAAFIYRQQNLLQGSEGAFMYFLNAVILLSPAMLLHGLYDTLLKKEMDVWALVIALISFVWLFYMLESTAKGYDKLEKRFDPEVV